MKSTVIIALLIFLQPAMVYADAEVNFSGTLVEEPCMLAPEDSAIEIDFGTVINKLLYSHKRTSGKPFTLHLLECDLSLGDKVSITFIGTEDADQAGMIALDASSTTSGIAIGIETLENELIPINRTAEFQTLKKGSNEINLQIFISAENKAINEKTITPGQLTTNITFLLNYE